MKIKHEYVTKFVLYIYLIKRRQYAFKSIPLDEDEIDQFYAELNDSNTVMEFGTFYFNKSQFDHAIAKEVKVKKD